MIKFGAKTALFYHFRATSGLGLILPGFWAIMERIPGDVLSEIFGQFDDLRDMIHLARTCRCFWAKYVEIRAKLSQTQVMDGEGRFPAVNIIIKNYRFEITYMHSHILPLAYLKPVKYAYYNDKTWPKTNCKVSMDFCLRRDNNEILIIYHNPHNRTNNGFAYFSRIYVTNTEIVHSFDQIKKYLYCYNTFLKNTNIDQQYRDFFLTIPGISELLQ